MDLLVKPTLGESGTARSKAREVSLAFLRTLNIIADKLDESPVVCIFFIGLCFVPVALLQDHNKLLTNDEIYTVHISQAPSMRAMFSLAREIDLHPPLHYLAQRLALHLPLPRWLGSRLPSMIAGLVVSFALFRFTEKRFGRLFGLIAVSMFWFSPALDFAWVNRPYMLWLAFLCSLLLARDLAVQVRRPWWAVPAVFALTVCMVGTHLLGIACIGPFLLAEAVRSRSRKCVDWPLVLALSTPALLGFGFSYQIHHISANAFPPSQMPSAAIARDMYIHIFGNAAEIVTGLLVVLVLLFISQGEHPAPQAEAPLARFSSLIPEDLTVLLGLLLLPLLLFFAAHLFNLQFWGRYGAASMPALAVLGAWVIARRLPLGRPLAVCVLFAAVAYMAYILAADMLPQSNVGEVIGGRSPISLSSLDPSIPIVVASPMTYVEMSDREAPAIAHRVFYLTDVDAAYRFAHYTLFENEDKVRRLLNLPSQTEDLSAFLSEHSQFYMVGDYNAPEIWLPRALASRGMKLDYLGKFESSYESDDLYLVSR